MKKFFNKVQNKANELAIRAKTTLENAKAEGYGALMYTTFGKVTLAICGAVMLFTFLRMQKYCKPVEYRR